MSAPEYHESVEVKIELHSDPRDSLAELRKQFEETRGWLFRGHRCADWLLEATVVRCAKRNGTDIQTFEQHCFKEFTRRAHDYFQNLPHAHSAAEWLGFMQHHGAPTRLN